MAHLYNSDVSPEKSQYWLRQRDNMNTMEKLHNSKTLYVGNMTFYTTEEQIYELFSKCGEIKRIIMGLDRLKKTPCGFCFVEYYTREDAEDCVKYLNGTCLDERIVRVDWDPGFTEVRRYGRGKSGGQVRDEYRNTYDPGRGGYSLSSSSDNISSSDDKSRSSSSSNLSGKKRDYAEGSEGNTGDNNEVRPSGATEDVSESRKRQKRNDDYDNNSNNDESV
eukprot:TRINITY_DN1813_c0_g1_i1.p1 TRINITY_DN1813_c0_g1~~TRINITY_DN1813_c0_g1_i1.p1  ORF type:complete len:221 (-),score=69.56 TRINITY_DN1813_c0_g1_i1:154-816(-)